MTAKFFERLSSDLNDLLKNSDEYNVIVEVGQAPNNQVFKVHSVILNSRCLYFKNQLNSITYNDNNVKIIKQTNVSVEVFDLIIKYIYNGTICLENVDTSIVFELLIVSNEFGLEELVKHAQLFLLKNNASWLCINFSRVYQASFKYANFIALQHLCTNIISLHPNILFDSDEFINLSEDVLIFILKLDNLQIDEGKIWDHVIKWGIAQNPTLPSNLDQWSDEHFMTLKNSLQNCLPLIRYFQISGEDVFEKVRPYHKILDSTLWADIMLKFMAPNKTTITSNILPPRNNNLLSQNNDHIDNSGLEIELNEASALRKSGETHRIMGRYEESLVDLNKSLELEPNNAVALKNRGSTYLMVGRLEQSLSDLTKSLEIEPNDTWALINRGEVYRIMNRYEESLIDLTKSLEIKPNDSLALGSRGATYRIMGRYKESLADLNKSLEIEPNYAFALRNRGVIYRVIGRYKESLADLNKSLEVEPNNAFALEQLGITERLIG
ncbi:hypothetical protein C2G38_542766 [Gigaspora rosea]|uniref:BTB domain-containing protein n=1 Tax=Gigaspora rosea TaxID=44941 RepID=A0A397UFI9_9GLOM|nr:hypothetical protein C2G38_542766 [Gigaspora rosea]